MEKKWPAPPIPDGRRLVAGHSTGGSDREISEFLGLEFWAWHFGFFEIRQAQDFIPGKMEFL
jgi:hypothetical protein